MSADATVLNKVAQLSPTVSQWMGPVHRRQYDLRTAWSAALEDARAVQRRSKELSRNMVGYGRLKQFTGTCWFNSAFNAVFLNPALREYLLAKWNALPLSEKRDICSNPALSSDQDCVPLDACVSRSVSKVDVKKFGTREWTKLLRSIFYSALVHIYVKRRKASNADGNFVTPMAAVFKSHPVVHDRMRVGNSRSHSKHTFVMKNKNEGWLRRKLRFDSESKAGVLRLKDDVLARANALQEAADDGNTAYLMPTLFRAIMDRGECVEIHHKALTDGGAVTLPASRKNCHVVCVAPPGNWDRSPPTSLRTTDGASFDLTSASMSFSMNTDVFGRNGFASHAIVGFVDGGRRYVYDSSTNVITEDDWFGGNRPRMAMLAWLPHDCLASTMPVAYKFLIYTRST